MKISTSSSFRLHLNGKTVEVRDVAPCMDCGHLVDLALTGKCTYAEYRYSGDLSLVLCNFCLVDFASYDPAYFGLPRGTCIDLGCFQFLRDVPLTITKDKFCAACGHRLPFLEFVLCVRELPDAD